MASEATPAATAAPGVKPGRLWIGGEYVDARDGATFTITNPATGEALTTCAQAGGGRRRPRGRGGEGGVPLEGLGADERRSTASASCGTSASA